MRKLSMICGLVGVLAVASVCPAQEMPEMPKPTKEHELLDKFTGKWKSRAEATMAPGQEPMVCEGTETSRLMGGFFLVQEGEANMMGMPMSSLMTIGYDVPKKKYVGTFVCSAGGELWQYEGSMDPSGKKLILTTEGPNMADPKKQAKYRETLQLVDADHKVFTSEMDAGDGKWQPIVKVTYERVK
jgi:hypothetical protein